MAKILLGMSGGVDSSAALGLLQAEGHEVTGVTLALLPRDQVCDAAYTEARAGIEAARQLAAARGIPHRVIDAKARFQAAILDPFAASYLRGETPNPCILCNQWIKFGLLYDVMVEDGFDGLATGHYARIRRTDSGEYRLAEARDRAKDQSYFLYRIAPDRLARIHFPLADLTKQEVRAYAGEQGMEAHDRSDSEDICFIRNERPADWIRRQHPEAVKPGVFRDQHGDVLGEHPGIAHFTEGQRRGLGIALGRRRYVTRIDASTGSVYLGDNEDLMKRTVELRDWRGLIEPDTDGSEPDTFGVKIRYGAKKAPAHLTREAGDRAVLHFETPVRAPAPGQSAVLYTADGDVYGGGIIDRAT